MQFHRHVSAYRYCSRSLFPPSLPLSRYFFQKRKMIPLKEQSTPTHLPTTRT